ncbi:MAG TPA: hypothetical protein VFD36_27070 [Kofleriaceae bacterium]|nr:hypothetical protein [Kofleriaceae bacterium]
MKRCAAALLLVTAATTTATAQSHADPTPVPPVPPPATNGPPADPSAPPQPRPPSDQPQLLPPGAVRPLPPLADSREPTGGWLAQFIVGSVGGFGGLWSGGLIGYSLECASGCDRDLGGLLGALVGAGIGVPTGATIGVVLTDDRDHEGSGALTFIGSALGSVAGWYLASGMFDDSAFGTTVVVGATSALGGTLMYRLTRTRKTSASALRVVPLGGETYGLAVVGSLW